MICGNTVPMCITARTATSTKRRQTATKPRLFRSLRSPRGATQSTATSTTTYKYTYDSMGNITHISDAGNVVQYRYEYDALGQLTREDNRPLGHSYVYAYDDAGNILSKTRYAFTTGDLGEAQETFEYTYSSSSWGDLMGTYGTDEVFDVIVQDELGNTWRVSPVIDGGTLLDWGTDFFWNGRQLMMMREFLGLNEDGTPKYTNRIAFEYNADGIRTSKRVDSVEHRYALDGNRVLSDTWTFAGIEYQLHFIYDESGYPIAIRYRDSSYEADVFKNYFLERNLQGDIVAIYNEEGEQIGTYTYDAWGNCTVSTPSNTTGVDYQIAYNYNPFRYRSSFYDVETGLYYLQSRYYNPEWGRFINADAYVSTGQGLLGNNMYAYCGNDPVNRVDYTGQVWSAIWEFAKTAVTEIGKAMGLMSPAYAGCGGAAVADGPLPFGDIIAAAGAALLTVGAIGYGIYQATQAPAISIPKAEEKAETMVGPMPTPTIIYRYYSSKNENLSPRQGVDYDGLSFSTKPPRLGVSAVITTIEQVNATGILTAIPTGGTHITVMPTNGTVIQWMEQGQSSIWSQTLSMIVVEWDGGF